MINFIFNDKSGKKNNNVSIFYKCKFYQDLLYNIKITLLVNKKTLTLYEFCFLILNSRNKFKEIILNEDRMRNIIIFLSIKFKDFFAIRYNSIVGYVIVLLDKFYNIPSIDEIKEILFKSNNIIN